MIEEVERRKKIRDEIRRGRNRDDVRDIDIRPKSRFIHQNANTKIPKRGVTYHYGLDNDKKEKEGEKEKDDRKKSKSKELDTVVKEESPEKDKDHLKSQTACNPHDNRNDIEDLSTTEANESEETLSLEIKPQEEKNSVSEQDIKNSSEKKMKR